MSFVLRKKNNSQAKRLLQPNIISQTNKNLKINYINYLNNFKNKIFSSKKASYLKSLTPSNHPKIFLSKEKSYFLPPKSPEYLNKKTLILDLDETLVHSSFDPFQKNDIVLNINFDGIYYKIYVLVRPGAEEFIKNISQYFELVVFTASISKYASPLLDILDKEGYIQHRLYRDNCTFLDGIYVKPLKKIGRSIKDIIIVDNSPLAYAFDNDNGLPITSWFDDKNDKELFDITPLLIFLSKTNDVRKYIEKFVYFDKINYSKALKIIDEEINKKENILNDINNDNIEIDNYEQNNNMEIQVEENDDDDKNININYIDNLNNTINNKKNYNQNNKIPLINPNIFPLKYNNINFISKKNYNNNIKIINNNFKIMPLKSLNEKISINNFEIKESKTQKNIFLKDNINTNDINDINKIKSIKKNSKLFLNLTQKNSKDKLLNENNNKSSRKNKISLNKNISLANSNTCKNIFNKNYRNDSNKILINLYKKNKNNSNINILSYKNTYNFNNIDLLNQYNINNNYKNNNIQSNNKKLKDNHISFRNKTTDANIIENKIKSKNNKNKITYSKSNKDFIHAKNKSKKDIFSKKDDKSKSTGNFRNDDNDKKIIFLNKNETKLNTDFNIIKGIKKKNQ